MHSTTRRCRHLVACALAVTALAACGDGGASGRPAIGVLPPDSIPAWFEDDTSLTADGKYIRNVLTVAFRPGATVAQRKAAIDLVGGRVIGGMRFGAGEGEYFVLVRANGDVEEMMRLMSLLQGLPYVEVAGLEAVMSLARFDHDADAS